MRNNRSAFRKDARRKFGKAINELAVAFKQGRPIPERKRFSRKSAEAVWLSLEVGPSQKVRMPRTDKLRGKLLTKDNFGEKVAKKKLKYIGARFEREYPVRANGKLYFIDFYVKSVQSNGATIPLNIALEVDGSVHALQHVKANDLIKNDALLSLKYVNSVLRITVQKMANMSTKELHDALLNCPRGVTKLAHTQVHVPVRMNAPA